MTFYLHSLGVKPLINCHAVRSFYGNTAVLPEVRDAMAEIASSFVLMDELQMAISKRLAELTGAEAGLVTCGTAASLYLCAAGILAGNDPERILLLPQTFQDRPVVLIPKGQRFSYDHAFRLCGLEVIEASTEEAQCLAKTRFVAMVSLLGYKANQTPEVTKVFFDIARSANAPVIVDAASEFLIAPNPWLEAGADIVLYSGSKFLRGPQGSGIMLGRANLIEAAWRNASPQQASGRSMKAGQDQMLGGLVAVESWLTNKKYETEIHRCFRYLENIREGLSGSPGLMLSIEETSNWPTPRLRVDWSRSARHLHADDFRNAMRASEPRVNVDDLEQTETSFLIDAFSLTEDQCVVVANAIASHFENLKNTPPEICEEPRVDISGEWNVEIAFAYSLATHRLIIQQMGARLKGEHCGGRFETSLAGKVSGERVKVMSAAPFEGVSMFYEFDGAFKQDKLQGVLTLGAGSPANKGELGARQFGTATFVASRV